MFGIRFKVCYSRWVESEEGTILEYALPKLRKEGREARGGAVGTGRGVKLEISETADLPSSDSTSNICGEFEFPLGVGRGQRFDSSD